MSAHLTQEQDQWEDEVRVLWAPWRMRYIEAEKPSGCIFCPATDETALRSALIQSACLMPADVLALLSRSTSLVAIRRLRAV